jgi:3',5'-cyclic AMP phosphodiesterase CpdA
MKNPIMTVLHMSDMHLGSSFQDAGGPHKKRLHAAIEGALQMQSHNPQILLTLPLELRRIWRLTEANLNLQSRGGYGSRGFFDATIVTGDISTDATSAERFGFAFEYLTSRVKVLTSGMYSEQSVVGLAIPAERLFCVPGNHDKMRETTLDRYYSGFAQAPARLNYVTFVRRTHGNLLFFGLDSNDYTQGNIALGEIDDARLAWLSTTLTRLDTEGLKTEKDHLTPEEFQTAVKCLVLHHHPVDLRKGLRGLSSLIEKRFTLLRGSDRLLDLIKNRIDVIFHGHEHFPICFRHAETGSVIISAGTVSEWNEKSHRNSFYTVTFFEDYSLMIEEYIWTGTNFESREQLTGREPQIFQLKRRTPSVAVAG